MPYKCAVPNCRGNYFNGPKVTLFSFPREKELNRIWVNAINRANFSPTKYSKVCELHFRPEDIRRESSAFDAKKGVTISVNLKRLQIRDGAVPSIFPTSFPIPSSVSNSKKTPNTMRIRVENSALEMKISEVPTELDENVFDGSTDIKQEKFNDLDDIEMNLNFLDRNYWSVIRQQDTLIIYNIIKSPYPLINLSLLIEADFRVHVFYRDVEMKIIGAYKVPKYVKDQKTLEILIENIKKIDVEQHETKPQNMISILKLIMSFLLLIQEESSKHFNSIKFIYEQLNLMTRRTPDYSSEMMIFSSLLHNCSPEAYKWLRNSRNIILPCYPTIARLTLSTYMNPLIEEHINFLAYIKNKFKSLVQNDITVALLVDEIHLKHLDYKGGNIDLSDDSDEAATSAYVFMLSSVFSPYKDVVHVMPNKCLKAESLFDIIKCMIIGLEEVGFQVLSVVTDNKTINKKAISLFCSPPKLSIVYPHPVLKSRPLFFLFNSVQLLKCIRNNWLDQKDASKCMLFPKFCHNGNHQLDSIQSAPFCTLQKLHALESPSVLLTSKALSPTNLEKQDVDLVMQIFSEYTVQGLLTLGKEKCLPNFAEVAEYINIFYIWWTIMNVKTPNKGFRLRNKYCNPLTVNEENFRFLSVFCDWLDSWNNISGKKGKLTKDTFTALHHTTYAFLELTKYCMEELKMLYILPGKFQTDHYY